jgi:hypothetical protein
LQFELANASVKISSTTAMQRKKKKAEQKELKWRQE